MEHKLQQQERRPEGQAEEDNLSRDFQEAGALEANYSFSEASGVYERILSKDPKNQRALTRLLHCLLLDGRSHAAAVRAESITGLAPDEPSSAEAYLVLARVHAGEADHFVAGEFYEKARRLDNCIRDAALEKMLPRLADDGDRITDGRSPGEIWRDGFDQVPSEWPVEGFYPIGENTESPFELSRSDDDEDRGDYDDKGFFDAIESEMGASGMSIASFEEPEVSFRDIGGYRDLKERLRLQFYYPMQHESLFRDYGREAGGSVLLYGPNGCGKTMLAKAVAREAGRPLITVGAQQILEAGEAASARLRNYFDMARCQLPCVLFFDNASTLLGDSDHALRSQFLEELNRIESGSQQLLVIFATCSPWKIDPIFRRSGRFRETMMVDVPSRDDRVEVIRVLARNLPLVKFDAAKVAARTEGFTGAELRTMFDIATRKALIEALRNRGETANLTTRCLLDAASTIRPSSMVWFEELRRHLDNSMPIRGGEDILAHLR